MRRRFLLLLSVIALALVIFAGCDGGNGGSSENGQSADHAHHLITVEAHEGSCTEDGWKEYVYCDVEGCGYTTKNVIKAKGHSIVKVDEKAPTCLEDGNNSYEYCKNDGCDYATEKIITPALGHDIEKVAAKQSTCKEAGWNEYEHCKRKGCDYSTKTELPKKEHELLTAEAKAPTCHEAGWDEYRYCKNCDYSEKIELPTTGHNLVTAEAKAPTCSSAGWAAYKYCSNKGCDYSEKVEIPMIDHDVEKGKCKNCDFTVKETVDFCVEVPEGRNPVVLQLTDPQILDSAQDRTNRLSGGEKAFYATENVGKLCFDYITETINAVKPDLIVMTGDLVYGEFDDSGASFIKFVNFMETFGIPWAPVMGNHEGTSRKGYDWQCKILENAKNCMFLQRTLTGNGNYSVGIIQSGELKRVFFMLDSNGCGDISAESLANGHSTASVGFGKDQINWYTGEVGNIRKYSPDVNLSIAFHIQFEAFRDAFAKYGMPDTAGAKPTNIYKAENRAETDFGYLGRGMKGTWDTDKKVYNGLKALGFDSIFVGHEHNNCGSVVYEGIRFQYGQKSSEYDRYNGVNPNDYTDINIGYPPKGGNYIPLIGGTIIPLDGNGDITKPYIRLCDNAGGKIDWNYVKPEEPKVNGLQLGTDLSAESALTVEAVNYSGVNAYKVTANSQGKIFVNANLLKNKKTISFALYVPATSTAKLQLKPAGEVSVRVKPNALAGDGYIIMSSAHTDEKLKIPFDEWKTYTFDISSYGETCTEFSIIVAKTNVVYLKDFVIG